MGKPSTIDAFFKRKTIQNSEVDDSPSNIDILNSTSEEHPCKVSRKELNNIDISSLERDPGLRRPIWEYPIHQRDEVRRKYIMDKAYQPILSEYPSSGPEKHPRRFNASWFTKFSSWLEYSPSKDAAFCLPCYVFDKPNAHFGSNAFTTKGFRNWKKVLDGKNCAFLCHIGTCPNSPHNIAMKSCEDLMAQSKHIDMVLARQCSQQVAINRLRVKTSIDAIRWLTFQACALRGNDESPESINRGNFLELVKLLASYNENVAEVVLENAPQNAQYIASSIQKEILHIFARKVRSTIREEIGEGKFCIIVDEARDESKREQMAIVLRFVDKDGCIQERFFDLVHIPETSSITLKNEISAILSRHNLSIHSIRGQGYDGASNMRGEWNGLQALFLRDCPYAYYIHCLAHRLQLALVTASREVIEVHQFFNHLSFAVNIVGASCKRQDELRLAQALNIADMIVIEELETGTGLNQIGTLQRAGDTRWGSHLSSIRSLIIMFDATCSVLKNIIRDGTYSQRGDADAALGTITSFDFVFILHLMRELLGITDDLCQALQKKSQDILNAMNLVSSTKILIQNMRELGWENFIRDVKSFCEKHEIDFPDMNAPYAVRRGRAPQTGISIEHHYRIDLFTATIDTQLQELNSRFNENAVELLVLSAALDPRDNYKLFNVDDICKLANKYYPDDFTEQEKLHLRIQLQHYKLDVPQHAEFKNLFTISELCQGLMKTRKAAIYPLVDRLIRLVLTLPVSTATTERSFSAMKIVKTKLRNKMEDDYLANYLVTYIERSIAEKFSTDSIIDDFYDMKKRRVKLRD